MSGSAPTTTRRPLVWPTSSGRRRSPTQSAPNGVTCSRRSKAGLPTRRAPESCRVDGPGALLRLLFYDLLVLLGREEVGFARGTELDEPAFPVGVVVDLLRSVLQ